MVGSGRLEPLCLAARGGVADDRVPERLAEAIEGETRRDGRASFDALDPFRTPVDIRQSEPQSKLIEGETERDPENEGNAKMPAWRAGCEGRKSGEHQEQDARHT